jgi:peptidyl-prolyl cis-trans isomerase-like 4
MSVLLETSLGDIVVDLHTQGAPTACLNFLKLCKLKYYNDTHFFHVQPGFVARGGDPTNSGGGGASVFAVCGIEPPPPTPPTPPAPAAAATTHARGTISLAGGVAARGSQFFLTLADGRDYLDADHDVFGAVSEGAAVLERLGAVLVDGDFRPYRLVRLRHTVVLHDPFPDPPGFPAVLPASPPPAQGGDGDRLGSEEEEDGGEEGDAGAGREAREARSRAEVLEMLGDLEDADVTPPENVLFVCKLNPVTEGDDLEIIFSRFGECRAEVMRDGATGASLCYGFVEFESAERAERAFFKLDGCLIDDRRVKVDFSQSGSRLGNVRRRARRRPP